MQPQPETQPILQSNSPNGRNTIMATTGTNMAITPASTSHSSNKNNNNNKINNNNNKSLGSQSSANHRTHGTHGAHGNKPTTPRTDQSEKANIRILQEVLQKGCETGNVEKKQLPPAICRVEGMKLWREVLNTNVYNGIMYVFYFIYFIAILRKKRFFQISNYFFFFK